MMPSMSLKTRAFSVVIIWLLFSALSVSVSQAEEALLEPKDFASGAELVTEGSSAFYRLTLPEEVLLNTAWPDLRDVRVFNQAGQVMTFATTQINTAKTDRKETRLRIFPMQMNIARPAGNKKSNTVIFKSSSGIEIQLEQNKTEQVARAYLLQLNKGDSLSEALHQIELDWTPSESNWQATASVSGSRDLRDWQELARDVPLMDLTSGEERLTLNHIRLRHYSHDAGNKYWLVVLREDNNNPLPGITGATGSIISQSSRTETVALPFSQKSTDRQTAEYQLVRPQPLSGLSIEPAQKNSVIPLSIEYRSSLNSDWHTLTNTAVYHMDENDRNSVSPPVVLKDQIIQAIRIKAINSSWGNEPPRMTGLRNRVDLIFNAQGSSPYLLAWGSKIATHATTDINTLIPEHIMPADDVKSLPVARLDHTMVLGGEARMSAENQIERRERWKIWLLWGLLVVGVAGLAFIAFKLIREVSTAKHK